MFEFEREVRAIAFTDTNDPNLVKGEFGFEYPIDPETLIRSVWLHPEADGSLQEIVTRAISDYAPKLTDKVSWSAMRGPPPLLTK